MTDKLREALKTCPFCNAPGECHTDGYGNHHCGCSECGACTSEVGAESQADAIAIWNRRSCTTNGGSVGQVADLAMLVRKLIYHLSKAAPDNEWPAKALDYLKRHKLDGSVLRNDEPAATVPVEVGEIPTWQDRIRAMYVPEVAEQKLLYSVHHEEMQGEIDDLRAALAKKGST